MLINQSPSRIVLLISEKFGELAGLIYGLFPMEEVIEGYSSAFLCYNPFLVT